MEQAQMRSPQQDSVESFIYLNVGVSCIPTILCLVPIQKKGAFKGGNKEHTKNFISTDSWKMGLPFCFPNKPRSLQECSAFIQS